MKTKLQANASLVKWVLRGKITTKGNSREIDCRLFFFFF